MDRRDYLKAAGAAATAATIGVGAYVVTRRDGPLEPTDEETPVRPPPTPPREEPPGTEVSERRTPPDRFDAVIDMVDDAGCDPTGERPCEEQIEEAAANDTLLLFPEGTYLVSRTVSLLELRNFGILGDGEVTFVAPPNLNDRWIAIDRGADLLFENVDLDVRAENAAPTLYLGVTDGLEVRDVEVIGRGTRRGSEPRGEGGNVKVGTALYPIVRSPDGEGVVENFVARHGGRIGTYNQGDGRIGIFIGQSTQGTVRLVNCRLEEFPNNGIYASRTHGTVHVVGGVFRNSDISQVRLGSEGSTVTGAVVEVDTRAVSDPSDPDDYIWPRGIRIESGPVRTAGVTVEDVDVTITHTPVPSAGVAVSRSGGRFAIENSRIRIDADGSPAIRVKPPDGGDHPPPPKPYSATIRKTEVTGDAKSGSTIQLFDRPSVTIEDTVIDQPQGQRDGVESLGSTRTTISGGRITVGRYPLVVMVPDGVDDGTCLSTIRGVTPFSGTTALDAARQLGGGSFVARVGRKRFCVTPSMAGKSPGVPTPVIAVTGIQDGSVYGTVFSKEALEPY